VTAKLYYNFPFPKDPVAPLDLTPWTAEETILFMKFNYFLLIFLILVGSDSAFAYLDPGTGSMLLQVILGGIAAIGVALKLFWHKIRIALGVGRKAASEDEAA
jgi:hypothetical protein